MDPLGFLHKQVDINEFLSDRGKDAIHRFIDFLFDFFPSKGTIPLLTYSDALRWFSENRPPDKRARRGVILREQNTFSMVIIQLFLDDRDNIVPLPSDPNRPLGRRLIVEKLDNELAAAFGNTDLIVVS